LRLGIGLVVDVLQVRRLPAETRAVVDDLAVDLARRVVDEAHRSDSVLAAPQSLKRLSMSASVISANTEGCELDSLFFTRTSMTFVSSVAALRTRRRTSPSELRSSNSTTRIRRCATIEMCTFVRSPSWN